MGCGASAPDERPRRYTRNTFRTQSSVAIPSDTTPIEYDFDIVSLSSADAEDGKSQSVSPEPSPKHRNVNVSPAAQILLSPVGHKGLLIPHAEAGGQFRAVEASVLTSSADQASQVLSTSRITLPTTEMDSPTLQRTDVPAAMLRSFTHALPEDDEQPQQKEDTEGTASPVAHSPLSEEVDEYHLHHLPDDDGQSFQSDGHVCEEPGAVRHTVNMTVATLKARVNQLDDPKGEKNPEKEEERLRLLKTWDESDHLTNVISAQRMHCKKKVVTRVVLWSGEVVPPVPPKR